MDDVSGLQSIEKLSIDGGSLVTDISMLKTLKELNVDRCDVSEFRGLINLRKLKIGGNLYTEPFVITSGEEVFENLNALQINNIFVSDSNPCDADFSVLSFSHLKRLNCLTLVYCSFTQFSSPSAQLRELRIDGCICESLILELPSLAVLTIAACGDLANVEISGKNGCDTPLNSVSVSFCDRLTDLVITRRMFVLKIRRCAELSCLTQSQINYLKNEDCPNLHISAFAPIVCLTGDEESERDYFVRRYQDN
jgi:hypothetical protein